MSLLHIMNSLGDKRVEWQPDDPKSITKVKRAFKKAMKDGKHFAFGIKKGEMKGEPIKEFSSDYDRILISPGFPLHSGG